MRMIQKKNISRKRGAFILELLIVISLLSIILLVSSQVVFISLQSAKVSGERDVAMGYANETMAGVRATVDESWRNLYDVLKSPSHYHTAQLGNKWSFVVGDDTAVFNNTTYTKYFVVENVCRDDSTRVVTGVAPCAPGSSDDPSTQKVTATVLWGYSSADSLQITDYLYRWKNKGCTHTDWSGGQTTPSDTVSNCTANTFFSGDASIDNTSTPGSIKLN